jgi:hypothetical protein
LRFESTTALPGHGSGRAFLYSALPYRGKNNFLHIDILTSVNVYDRMATAQEVMAWT